MFIPILANIESPWFLLVVLVLALLLFGHKLPQLARGLGSSVSEFKKGIKEGENEANREADAADKDVAKKETTDVKK
jgi:sec-independent protein translocase protein TatA